MNIDKNDSEQTLKQVEILDVLVASGYFRARLRSYDDFDKIVGGMIFCLEGLDNIDLDVDFLFHDSLSIGQKIALTEKIVAVLPKIGCPYTLEPHQIQGLDFINIFPVVQWLVKKSIDSRAEKADRLNLYAINQFYNDFRLQSNVDQLKHRQKLVTNLNHVQEQLKPKRKFRKIRTSLESDAKLQVKTTLLEYVSQTAQNKNKLIAKDSTEGNAEILDRLIEVDEVPINFDEDNRQNVFSEYNTLKLEFGDDDQIKLVTKKINELEETKVNLEKQLMMIKKNLNQSIERQKEREYEIKQLQDEKIGLSNSLQFLKNKHTNADADTLAKLTYLLQENEAAKQKEIMFKNECKNNMSATQTKIKDISDILADQKCVSENLQLLQNEKQQLAKIRLKVSKKTRQLIVLNRALDVPSRSELAQYQRRFLELYTQVSYKHKETKQFFTLYNVLNDTKQYIEKEKNLLNSIYENFSSSMSNPTVRDQFLRQFESIVMGVKENKNKVLKKQENEKLRKEQLCATLIALLELQRKYVTATKKLQQLVTG